MKRRKRILAFVLALVMVFTAQSFNVINVKASDTTKSAQMKYGNHLYQIYYGEYTWTQAKQACKKLGGHLATITSQKEQNFIDNYLNTNDDKLWIGGYKASNGKWKWVTGEKWSYTNWGDGEPNNYLSGHENCITVYPDDWNDMADGNVDDQVGFICEWDYSLTVSSSSFVLEKGDMASVKASAKGSTKGLSSKNVTYTSSKPSVVKVSSKGKMKALSAGTTVIKAKLGAVTKSIKVVVKPSSIKKLKASTINKTSLQLSWSSQKNVTGYVVYAYDSDFAEYTKIKTVKGYTNNTCFVRSINGVSLKKGKSYKFRVKAYIKSGSKYYYGPTSKTITVTTKR